MNNFNYCLFFFVYFLLFIILFKLAVIDPFFCAIKNLDIKNKFVHHQSHCPRTTTTFGAALAGSYCVICFIFFLLSFLHTSHHICTGRTGPHMYKYHANILMADAAAACAPEWKGKSYFWSFLFWWGGLKWDLQI